MNENTRPSARHRVANWCLVLLGLVTFAIALVILAFLLWVVVALWAHDFGESQRMTVGLSGMFAFCASLALLPIYIGWVLVSRRLTWSEKGLWLFLVVFLNAAGMPLFYVFMVRRYHGLEGRWSARDEAAVNALLKRCHASRDRLSSEQLGVLRSYCRQRRQLKWMSVPMTLLFAAMLCMVVRLADESVEVFVGLGPTRVMVVDPITHSQSELSPDSEADETFVRMVMTSGAALGVLGSMVFFAMFVPLVLLLVDADGRTLIKFLKASGGEDVPRSST
jgi:hypothetical protein